MVPAGLISRLYYCLGAKEPDIELFFTMQMDLPEDFFQLLVEVVKVEALITLRDALSPTERIPLAHTSTPVQPSTSTAAQEEPSSSALAQVEEDSDDDTEGAWQPADLLYCT